MGEDDWIKEMHTKGLLKSMKRTPKEPVAHAYGEKSFASYSH
jgi:hypothetical protein